MPLRLAATSAADAGIHKKTKTGTATLIMLNEEIEDNMEAVKSFADFDLRR